MLDVRRLAGIDMYGTAGGPSRRRIILWEFILGAVACLALGFWVALSASGVWRGVGIYLFGIGLNYVPLAVFAIRLSPPGVLDAELADVDVAREIRRYSAAQLWLFVPCVVAVFAIVGRERSTRRRSA